MILSNTAFSTIILFSILCSIQIELSNGDLLIVNGEYAAEGQFPYMVSKRHKYKGHFCGGSILSKHWIVTAGHCVDRVPNIKMIYAAVGSRLNYKGDKYTFEKIVLYNQDEVLQFDMALVKTQTDIDYGHENLINEISLGGSVESGVAATISGWGLTEVSLTLSLKWRCIRCIFRPIPILSG